MDLFSYLEEEKKEELEKKRKKLIESEDKENVDKNRDGLSAEASLKTSTGDLNDIAVKSEKKSFTKNKQTGTKSDRSQKILSVFQLTRKIKSLIEENLSSVWVEGEISNYKKHSSGHHYFSIKDDRSVINCVMWRYVGDKLNIRLDNGLKVKIFGRVTIFEAGGKYQVEVKKVELAGIGDLQQQFEMLKKKLDSEGVFRAEHKKKLPEFAKNIGVITAETGAAFQDIKKVTARRAPFLNIYLYNSRVQGVGAAEEISSGIELMNKKLPFLDLMIIGRGGGSLEDLWPFNEEIVARSIFSSKIPVISAVGHEIDFSISDFTADVRAATPSHGAELATVDSEEENQKLCFLESKLNSSVKNILERQKIQLDRIENSHAFKRPADIIKNYTMVLDNLSDKLGIFYKTRLDKSKSRLDNLENLLKSLGPDSILGRGYAIVTRKDDRSVIDSKSKVKEEDVIGIRFKDGMIESVVK